MDIQSPMPKRSGWRKTGMVGVVYACLFSLLLGAQWAFAGAAPLVAPSVDSVAPDAPGSIAGVVTDGTLPLAGIQVTAFQLSPYGTWQSSRAAQTNAAGEYKIGLLGAGVYRLLFRDPTGVLAQTYYPGVTTIETAADIPVAGNNVANINVTLGAGGWITGTVTSVASSTQATDGGSLPSNFAVEAYQQVGFRWVSVQSYPLATDETFYKIAGLAPGIYRLCARNYLSTLQECYDNVYRIADGADIAVVAGETTANINFVLGDGADLAQISGTVSAANGSPLAEISVTAFRTTSDPYGGWYIYTQTNEIGVYQLPNLLPGRYAVSFQDNSGAYIAEFYSDTLSIDAATPVTLTRYEKRANVNASLAVAAQITGTLTVTDGVFVPFGYLNVYRKSNLEDWQPFYSSSAQFDSRTGQYRIGGLPAGVYKVRGESYVDNYAFVGFYGGKTLDAATPITLSGGEIRTHIAIPLTQAYGDPIYSGKISGIVTADGTPAANIKVAIYQVNCCSNLPIPTYPAPPIPTATPAPPFALESAEESSRQVTRSAVAQAPDDIKPLVYVYTDANGRYTIEGLNNGTYYLGFSDPAGTYATVYHPDQKLLIQAQPIYLYENKVFLQTGIVVSSVNAALVRGGGISGSVRLKDDTPVANLAVKVYTSNELGYFDLMTDEIQTDSLGNFTIRGLPAGLYRLCFVDLVGRYPSECYGDAIPTNYPERAATIIVPPGVMVSNITHVLGPKLQLFLPVVQQKPRTGVYFNIATVSRCERQPAGNWFEGTTNINGQPQSGYLVAFSYAPDGPILAIIRSGPHEGYSGWSAGYYSHIIHATNPQAGNWSVWIVDETGQRISAIATWQSTGPGEGCNQATVDFDSR